MVSYRVETTDVAWKNLMPLIECVENDITLGKICNMFRGVRGELVAEGF